ncbi:gpW family head-tail joining protein [Zavarzinia sp.]|uniref:gpW family head-tail joining protein n=1 Tax=Zavarzinia sp. TaxID=2027920 RepID=UPI003BB7A570
MDREVITARLAEAEAALHALSIGRRSVSVSYEGKAVTYTAGNIGELRAYVAELKAKLALLDGARPARRAIGLRF